MKRTGAVIAAAGLSSRMGDFKPLLPFGGQSIAEHMVRMLQEAGADPIVMVLGHRGEELALQLRKTGIRFVVNEAFGTTQMLDSVKLGLKEIKGLCDQVLIMPVDVPAVTRDTVRQVMDAGGKAVRPSCGGRCGHPVRFSEEAVRDVLAYEGPGGLRGFIETIGNDMVNVEVEDAGIFLDADTKAQYRRLLAIEGSRAVGYPDWETCLWFMETYHMSESVKRHGEAVSRKAVDMALALAPGKQRKTLDISLIRCAALLHDIAKGGKEHACRGGEILRKYGYPRAAEIIRQHHDLDRLPEQADETLIVYLADKLIQGEAEVSLDDRFEKSAWKCRGSLEAEESHARRYLQAKAAFGIWKSQMTASQI